MKKQFSLYTFFVNVYAGLRLGCTESHAKNITSLEKKFFYFAQFCFYTLEKFWIFSVHLYTDTLYPLLVLGSSGVQREKVLCTPLYTA